MGFYAYGTPKEIKLYDIYEDKIYVPTGFFNDLWKKHPYIDDYIDYSTSVPIEVTSNIKPTIHKVFFHIITYKILRHNSKLY
jgi:hypothetical protein